MKDLSFGMLTTHSYSVVDVVVDPVMVRVLVNFLKPGQIVTHIKIFSFKTGLDN